MKKFLKNHGLWILFAAAVISVLLAGMSVLSVNSSPLTDAVNTMVTPLQNAFTAIAERFNDMQNYYKDTTDLQAENAELRKKIAEMQEDVRQAEAALEENERLRELHNFRAQRRDLSDMEPCTVTEHMVTNWTSSLTLNKGTSMGVEVGDCVLDETGALVGIVSEAGLNWSTVLTVVDTDTSLGAMIFRTKELCVAKGDFSLMGDRRLRLDYLPADSQLLAGDLVVTSGLGEFYPSDLVIGSVEEIQVDDSGAASYAILKPEVAFDSLTEVFVLKSFVIVT